MRAEEIELFLPRFSKTRLERQFQANWCDDRSEGKSIRFARSCWSPSSAGVVLDEVVVGRPYDDLVRGHGRVVLTRLLSDHLPFVVVEQPVERQC